ncbi:16S rRNA (cytosine(1402)-N(4))-methyltransferase RsmH [Bradyrhizobium sp. WBAH42]|nr:16S rRNA (cytosine(1402)-N(4))-methyltransferase [Bradyrhizobium sp. WBAH30]MDD1545250.1 16S rRNA (cytosine(1402)-N(4))-methyltransferase [Bradyrhizobium sp. WBAH41]MDD1558860.1 16S rRNA (cytosine(1402)-N(4))-methyltransferase [Bradyrhizobium sp. WBAH23]MDD1565985.1 16S rRNA (cytosine(1402)-N(4))-methyltransferase [Bradyrhizobium sp. WBAH33]MDD1591457.1 16S rRNA (cytosine(1402)-N(4))-methyltransferase [Bradyrhizobium sp. WBAH42]NRB89658.1 16S rRNA (cytosine(1402)-N(4))-methyltransferase [Br
MAARQIPLGTPGLWPGTAGLGNHAGQGLCRGTAATRNDSRRYGLVRPRSRLGIGPGGRQALRMSTAPHIPVLGREAIAHLAPREGGVYVDATFGAGGYSRAILEVPGTRLIAIDRDRTAIAGGAELVERSAGRLTLVEDRFSNLAEVCAAQGVDGVVMDVGVSSMQLDQAGRGFSFRLDGPLDMRMGQAGPTAADVVARASEGDLADIIYLFGEERHSRRIARAIVADRQETPFTTTRALADLVGRVVRSKPGDIHPATRTFQALRIFVNEELEELQTALAAAERVLRPGGRLVVVSFHSLEDRIVKNFLSERSKTGGGSRHLPEVAQVAPSFQLLTRRPVVAGEDEVAHNPRARSAKLRAAERTAASAHETDEASSWPKLADVMRGG